MAASRPPVMTFRGPSISRTASRIAWRLAGREAGYPPCCIAAFVRANARSGPGPGLGFVRWWLRRAGYSPRRPARVVLVVPAYIPCGACRRRYRHALYLIPPPR